MKCALLHRHIEKDPGNIKVWSGAQEGIWQGHPGTSYTVTEGVLYFHQVLQVRSAKAALIFSWSFILFNVKLDRHTVDIRQLFNPSLILNLNEHKNNSLSK